MNIEEKRKLIHKYCNSTSCSRCILNDKKHGWKTNIECSVHCLIIDKSDEEDLDKAIALIEEEKTEKTMNEIRVANGFPPLKDEDFRKFAIDCIDDVTSLFNVPKEVLIPPMPKVKPYKSDNVNSPSHYTDGKIEVIDFIEDKKLGFCLGNAIKYISRAGKKDKDKESEDIRKAIWYLNRYLKELEEV